MLTDQEAVKLSRMLAEPGMLPQCRQDITRSLFEYYKQLLARESVKVPAVRRMW